MTEEIKDETYFRLKEEYLSELQRLKQENAELGKKAFLAEQTVRATAATFCDKDKLIEELKQENEKTNKDLLTERQENAELETENYKLRKALEEIRDYLNTLSSVDSDFVNTETYLRITDKINEVLG